MDNRLEIDMPSPEAPLTTISPRKKLANQITKAAHEVYETHKNPAAESTDAPMSSPEERRTLQLSALNEFVNKMQLVISPAEADDTSAHGITMTHYDITGGELPDYIARLLRNASHARGGPESFVITNPQIEPHVGPQPITIVELSDKQIRTTYYYFIRSGDDPGNFAMDGLQAYHEEADSPAVSFTPYNHNLNLIEIADTIIKPLTHN